MIEQENQFKALLDGIEADANACAVFGYFGSTINYMAADPKVLDRLNEHPHFWKTIDASLQASCFIALGRLFDSRSDTYTLRRLIEYAEKYRGIFFRHVLKDRKIRNGLAKEEAEKFVECAYEPKPDSLAGLRDQEKDMRAQYDKDIAPVRHKIFAHAGVLEREARGALFTPIMQRDMEAFLVFPLQLHEALFQLYFYGREPKLPDTNKLVADILDETRGPQGQQLEHVYIVREVAAFMQQYTDEGARE